MKGFLLGLFLKVDIFEFILRMLLIEAHNYRSGTQPMEKVGPISCLFVFLTILILFCCLPFWNFRGNQDPQNELLLMKDLLSIIIKIKFWPHIIIFELIIFTTKDIKHHIKFIGYFYVSYYLIVFVILLFTRFQFYETFEFI